MSFLIVRKFINFHKGSLYAKVTSHKSQVSGVALFFGQVMSLHHFDEMSVSVYRLGSLLRGVL